MLDFHDLAAQCAPAIAEETITAIVRTESGFNPIALHVNGAELERKPQSLDEAVAWAIDLIGRGYSVDIGLGQINSQNLASLGLSIEEAFEPCSNLRAAETILLRNYRNATAVAGEGQAALGMALSAYNTGSPTWGFTNGYVANVADKAASQEIVPAIDPARVIAAPSQTAQSASMPMSAASAPSVIIFIRDAGQAATAASGVPSPAPISLTAEHVPQQKEITE